MANLVFGRGAALTRRELLRRGGGCLLLVAGGAVLPSGCTRYPKPPPTLIFFTSKEYAVLNLLAARILGMPELEDGRGDGGIDVAATLDRLAASWDADLKRQLRLALRVVEHGTYLFDLQRKRLTKLTIDEQDSYISGWAASTLGARRVAFLGFKALVSLGFYGAAWDGIGYPGPWLGRVDVAPRLAPEPVVPAAELWG